jgi:hypothetical protein
VVRGAVSVVSIMAKQHFMPVMKASSMAKAVSQGAVATPASAAVEATAPPAAEAASAAAPSGSVECPPFEDLDAVLSLRDVLAYLVHMCEQQSVQMGDVPVEEDSEFESSDSDTESDGDGALI